MQDDFCQGLSMLYVALSVAMSVFATYIVIRLLVLIVDLVTFFSCATKEEKRRAARRHTLYIEREKMRLCSSGQDRGFAAIAVEVAAALDNCTKDETSVTIPLTEKSDCAAIAARIHDICTSHERRLKVKIAPSEHSMELALAICTKKSQLTAICGKDEVVCLMYEGSFVNTMLKPPKEGFASYTLYNDEGIDKAAFAIIEKLMAPYRVLSHLYFTGDFIPRFLAEQGASEDVYFDGEARMDTITDGVNIPLLRAIKKEKLSDLYDTIFDFYGAREIERADNYDDLDFDIYIHFYVECSDEHNMEITFNTAKIDTAELLCTIRDTIVSQNVRFEACDDSARIVATEETSFGIDFRDE